MCVCTYVVDCYANNEGLKDKNVCSLLVWHKKFYTVNQQKFTVKKSSQIAKTATIKRTKVFNRIHCNI